MKRSVLLLLIAQFLTAFADNAILFTAIVMVNQLGDLPAWYVPGLQAAFLLAFVLLAPWVGPYADARPKRRVLSQANMIKALGAGLLLLHIEPLLAYCVVGIGAALYSPAKYGILPELVGVRWLDKVNSWVEGSTILAILTGTIIGAMVAEQSIALALFMVMGLYGVSALIAMFIAYTAPEKTVPANALKHFVSMSRNLLKTARARYSTLGVSLFWGAAVVLRVLIVAWAPVALLMTDSSDISLLVLFIAVGIAIGSLAAPFLVPMGKLRRARLASYLMGMCIILLSQIDTLNAARMLLLLTGFCGGLFVVPINATLQNIGHHSVGTGGAVAVQHFFENLAMIACTSVYALAIGQQASPVTIMWVTGMLVLIATLLVSWRLPPERQVADEIREHLPGMENPEPDEI